MRRYQMVILGKAGKRGNLAKLAKLANFAKIAKIANCQARTLGKGWQAWQS